MERCVGCKHWRPLNYPQVTEYGTAWGPSFPDRVNRNDEGAREEAVWGTCKAVDFGPPDSEEGQVESRFFVIDGSEYDASLYTKPDHGCTEFEAMT